MATDTKLKELVINTMTKAQYDALETKDPNEIYVATDAKTGAQDLDTSNVGTTGQVLSKTDTGMEWKTVSGGGGDYLPLSGGALNKGAVLRFNATTGSFYGEINSNSSHPLTLRTVWPNLSTGEIYFDPLPFAIRSNKAFDIGSATNVQGTFYFKKLNNGADIEVPTTSGTMVVATPPTAAGNYVLKATVTDDGTVTTQWVAEA